MSENRERSRPPATTLLLMARLDPEVCYRALQTHDERFDGRLFVGVTSTGIYCRPVCRARPAKLENCRFYSSAAAAQEAGFRPCLRCRPETAPELGSWRGTSNTVSRGLALIAEGELDGRRRDSRRARREARCWGAPAPTPFPAASGRFADRRGANPAHLVCQAVDR